jgi:glycosyltransferase involved in cell wall biosynthesis
MRLVRTLTGSRGGLILGAAARGLQRGIEIVRSGNARVVSLSATPTSYRTALLSYSITSFLGCEPAPDTDPASPWITSTVARALITQGWNVDVVSDRNTRFLPSKVYRAVIASRRSLANLVPRLPNNCLKVLLLDSPDVLFQHAAECRRLLELKDRRGVILPPNRYERVTAALDHADYAILQGNEFTLATYHHARIPVQRVPAPALNDHPSPEMKDFDRCRSGFVWLGGRGLVHQGLDRTLEAFVRLPDLRLSVSAPVRSDRRFTAAYNHELYHAPNIRVLGPARLEPAHVAALARDSIAVVFPSCAEGQAAEVVACMAAGLIPIVTRESGIDVGEFGVIIAEASAEKIADAVTTIARLPSSRLRQMATAAWSFARTYHGAADVAQRYADLLASMLSQRVNHGGQTA